MRQRTFISYIIIDHYGDDQRAMRYFRYALKLSFYLEFLNSGNYFNSFPNKKLKFGTEEFAVKIETEAFIN